MDIQSPCLMMRSPARTCLVRASTTRSPQPTTHALPRPRATTAAWEVMPPRVVRIPWATSIPSMSSGEVSLRTSRTCSPLLRTMSTAFSADSTTRPHAAPGPAGKPLAMTLPSCRAASCSSRGKTGASSCTSRSGSTLSNACSRVIRPSSTISTAMRTAASPVRFPERVCSM